MRSARSPTTRPGSCGRPAVEPSAVFPAYMDLEPFLGPPEPLPERPTALFVGVLELYKNIDGLAAAWRLAAPRLPGAQLHIVGRGTRAEVVEALVRDLPRADALDAPARCGRRRLRAGRSERARAAVALGGDGPRDRRGALPGAAGAGEPRRRDPRPRPRRRERPSLRAQPPRRSPRRSSGCSAIARSSNAWLRPPGRASSRGSPRRSSTRRAWRRLPPRLSSCVPTAPSSC